MATYKKLTKDSLPVQVQSAIEDGAGNAIASTYATDANLTAHTSNTTIHVTSSDKAAWSAKAAGDLSNVNVGQEQAGKMVAVDTDGTLKYESIAPSGVQDVTLGGTSVVSSGVAALTEANILAALGMVFTDVEI